MDVDQTAPVITRDEIYVDAPVKTAWKPYSDINHWTNWNQGISSSKLESALAVGATFH